jgi:curved DNA-binding protein CbpA
VPTHYEVLGISRGASEEEVRQAYRRLVKAAHPDAAGDPARFRVITEAYDVLSDRAQREAYDRTLRPAWVAAPPAPRRRYGRYGLVVVVALVVAGAVGLVVATTGLSVGDDCLVGTWRGEAFEVPLRASLDGREVAAVVRGGAGVVLTIAADGEARADYRAAAPLTGAAGAHRIEGTYAGTTIERWQADDGRVRLSSTDTSALRFRVMISGRAPDEPVAVTALDREYPYDCTPTTLELGPYRYARA